MTFSIRCPKCQQRHSVSDDMAGTKAKCKCGAVITIPVPKKKPATAKSIIVQCPSCGQRHKAQPSMAGTQAKCPCGHVLTIPSVASQPKADTPKLTPIDDFSSPLGPDLGSIPDDPLGPSPLPPASTYLPTQRPVASYAPKPKRPARRQKPMPSKVVTAAVALVIPGVLSIVVAVLFWTLHGPSSTVSQDGVEVVDLADVFMIYQMVVGLGSIGVAVMLKFRVPGSRILGIIFSVVFFCGSCIHIICAICAIMNLSSAEAAEYFAD